MGVTIGIVIYDVPGQYIIILLYKYRLLLVSIYKEESRTGVLQATSSQIVKAKGSFLALFYATVLTYCILEE
jgi:hypothetical protein